MFYFDEWLSQQYTIMQIKCRALSLEKSLLFLCYIDSWTKC